MSSKKAVVKLFVTALSLMIATMNLIAAIVRLVTAGAIWAAARIEARLIATARTNAALIEVPIKAPANLRLVKSAPTAAPVMAVPVVAASMNTERLTAALTGMGFRVPAVKSFVTSLGG